MNEIVRIFMHRDGLTLEEAVETLEDMRQEVWDGVNPEVILAEYGLEPDYIFDLI